jgi:hypothetical protein
MKRILLETVLPLLFLAIGGPVFAVMYGWAWFGDRVCRGARVTVRHEKSDF